MISFVILTHNSQAHLKKVLESTFSFDEVLIIDTGSTDQSLEIAKAFPNVVIKKMPFTEFGKIRNDAANLAKNDWVFALDSDEVLSEKLIHELHQLQLDSNTIYSIPFVNFYNNKKIRSCGWDKESHPRLYHRKNTSFSEDLIHEKLVQKELKSKLLNFPIYHYSYQTISDFLTKMQRYTTLFAKQHQHKKCSSCLKAAFHGLFAFFKSYILKRGIFDGKEGFIISIYQANTSFYKYLKLAEANKDAP